MARMTDTPEDIGLDNKSAAERDRIDLNHEMSGENVGRIQRFLTSDGDTRLGENSAKRKAEREMSMLMYMLENDSRYAAAYKQVQDTLDRARQAVSQALIDMNQRLAVSDRELQKMRDNAAELKDGTKVFKSRNDDSIYTEDGKRLSDVQAAEIHVPESAPSWEEYQSEKEKRTALEGGKAEIEAYERDVLNPAQERMNDPDDPPSMDELKEIEHGIKEKMPASVRNISAAASSDITVTSSVAQDVQGNSPLSVPDINMAFGNAVHNVPSTPDIKPAQPKFEIPAIAIS